MKKIISAVIALMMLAMPVFAEGERTYSVNTDSGALLIDENGNMLTDIGEFDMIEPISGSSCPSERRLYMVSQLDLSSGFYMDESEEEVFSENDSFSGFFNDEWYGEWDEELDDVEEWPVDLEMLDEGYEMEVIDDVPAPADEETGEYGDVLDDEEGLLGDEYIDYGVSYGVALMNARGELLTGFDYESFWHDVENGVVQAYNFEGFVTMLDENGNVLTEGMYSSVVSDGNGGFFAVMPTVDGETGEFSEAAPIMHIDASGAVSETGIYTFSFETLPGFSEGYMCVSVCEKDADADDDYKYVYIDQNGEAAFGRYFEYAFNFNGGIAEVTDGDSQVRLINTKGENLTDGYYSYFDCGISGDNMPIIGNLLDGGFDLISKADYSVIASFRPENGASYMYASLTGDGFIMVNTDIENMLMDAAGNIVWRGSVGDNMRVYTGYEYTDSQPQRVAVKFTTENGDETYVADFAMNAFGGAFCDVDPISWVGGSGRYQVVNYELIEREFEDQITLDPDLESFMYGVIDQDGNTVIPMEYDYFMALDHDRYWVGSGINYKLLDSDGKVIVEFISE